jgi:PIN domain nuclease of toxin-antitoxin system
VKLLLDTHAFLWFIAGDARLSSGARSEIERIENDCFVSTASLWEIAIKTSLDRLKLPRPFKNLITEQMQLNAVLQLDIKPEHLEILVSLPFHHRDPFDRLLVAQAKAEVLTLVSADAAFDGYEVKRLW